MFEIKRKKVEPPSQPDITKTRIGKMSGGIKNFLNIIEENAEHEKTETQKDFKRRIDYVDDVISKSRHQRLLVGLL